MQKPADLHTSVFHSLEEQITVIDCVGNIIDVNLAWQNFGVENGFRSEYSCLGHNYLKALSDSVASGDSLAGEALAGITDVLAGKRAIFYFEYPCHSPSQERWFTMRVTALHGDESRSLFVISHHNITQRKLAEQQVERLAMHDPLTELSNRRAFFQFLTQEIRISIRNQTPLALILLDVDHFKNYNDEFGHLAGDRCLTDVSRVLLTHARRPDDLAARIGGDEFALILGNTGAEMTGKISKSILRGIDDLNLVFGDSQRITGSIGFISVIPNKQQNEIFLFHEADTALYQAKSAGRNQAVHLRLGQAR